jgi:hypothetical protein
VDGDVRFGRPLVEAARQQPVVLQVLRRRQQARRDRAGGIPEDALVDLHLAAVADDTVVRLEPGLVGIVVVAVDRPSGFTAPDSNTTRRPHPGRRSGIQSAARGIGRRQLVAAEVLDGHRLSRDGRL